MTFMTYREFNTFIAALEDEQDENDGHDGWKTEDIATVVLLGVVGFLSMVLTDKYGLTELNI